MALTRAKKEEIVKKLKEKIKQAKIVVFVNFHGLPTSAGERVSADELAEMSGTINYEIITRLNPLIKRFYK